MNFFLVMTNGNQSIIHVIDNTEHCGMNENLMVDRCSVDESGTKMQQIYTATTFSITKTYNIELKVHRNLLNKSIGLAFCYWQL